MKTPEKYIGNSEVVPEAVTTPTLATSPILTPPPNFASSSQKKNCKEDRWTVEKTNYLIECIGIYWKDKKSACGRDQILKKFWINVLEKFEEKYLEDMEKVQDKFQTIKAKWKRVEDQYKVFFLIV